MIRRQQERRNSPVQHGDGGQSSGQASDASGSGRNLRPRTFLSMVISILQIPLVILRNLFGSIMPLFGSTAAAAAAAPAFGLLEGPCTASVAKTAETILSPPPQLSVESYVSTLVASSNYAPTANFTAESPPSPAPSLLLVIITSSLHPSHDSVLSVVQTLGDALNATGARLIVMDAVSSSEATILIDIFKVGKLPWAGILCAVDLDGPLEGKVRGWDEGRPVDIVRQGEKRMGGKRGGGHEVDWIEWQGF